MTGAFDLGDGGDGQSMPGCLDGECDPTIPVLQNESAAFGVPPADRRGSRNAQPTDEAASDPLASRSMVHLNSGSSCD
jgi:hypothetical protein